MKNREKGIGFRKKYPLEYGLFAAGMACFLILFCVLAVVLQLRENRSQKEQSMERFSYALDSYFYSIDNLSTLIYRDNYLVTFRDLDRGQLYASSPLDIIEAKENIRYYDTVLGFYGKTYVYFSESDCFFSSDGIFEHDSFFVANNLPEEDKARIEEKLSDLNRYRSIFNVGDASFYIQHTDNFSIYLLYKLNRMVFSDMADAVLTEKEGIRISSDGQEFFAEGRTSGSFLDKTFKNLDVRILYYYDLPVWKMALTCSCIGVVMILLYFLFYRIISGFLNRYYRKVQEITLANDLDVDVKSVSVLVLLNDFIRSSAEKERQLRSLVRDSDRKTVAAYLRAWITGADGDSEEIAKALSLLNIDLSGFHCVYCFNGDCEEAEKSGMLRILQGVYLCSGGEFPQFSVRFGCSNAYRKLDGLRKAYAESGAALRLANLFQEQSIQFSQVEDDRDSDVFKPCLAVLEKDMTAGVEEHLAAVEKLFSLAEGLPRHLSVFFMLRRAEDILDTLRRNYNLEEADLLLPYTATLGEAKDFFKAKIIEYGEKLRVKLKNKYVFIFKDIMEYVNANLVDQDLSLKKIAGHFGYSVSYISRIFSENGEENYNEYINRRRIELAKRLLRENKPVNRIAELCGFNSDTSFRRVFLRIVKLTPLKYKALKHDTTLE